MCLGGLRFNNVSICDTRLCRLLSNAQIVVALQKSVSKVKHLMNVRIVLGKNVAVGVLTIFHKVSFCNIYGRKLSSFLSHYSLLSTVLKGYEVT